MHQVGLRNCVGIMGTALTDDQISELARLAPEVRLALDADNAGKEAMLRAERVARGRTPPLRLRVVALPAGEDPADLVKRTGGEQIERLVSESVPFVRFRVLRALETGDLADAEGRDRVIDELGAVLSPLGPSAEREELRRIAADRLDMSPELLEQRLPRGGGGAAARPAGDGARSGAPQQVGGQQSAGGPGRGSDGGSALGRREPTERSFLALCIALPALGAPALAELDLEADLTSAFTRRAGDPAARAPRRPDGRPRRRRSAARVHARARGRRCPRRGHPRGLRDRAPAADARAPGPRDRRRTRRPRAATSQVSRAADRPRRNACKWPWNARWTRARRSADRGRGDPAGQTDA